jgi:hypothetical protein
VAALVDDDYSESSEWRGVEALAAQAVLMLMSTTASREHLRHASA